ncbi:MAG: hypothetical protein N2C12_09720, partial [Planctomycetales bacterium]
MAISCDESGNYWTDVIRPAQKDRKLLFTPIPKNSYSPVSGAGNGGGDRVRNLLKNTTKYTMLPVIFSGEGVMKRRIRQALSA